MASLYEMAMGPQQSFYNDYQQVQQDKFANSFNQSKLADLQRADQARPLMGRALQGDKASLAALAGVDPQSYLDVGKFQSDQATTKRQLRESDMAFIGKAVANADTPEKYAQVMDYLQSQGFDVDEHDRNFANRGAIMDATATGGQAFTLSPGASRYDSKGNLVATAPGRPGAGQNAPSGFRWTQTGNLEPIPGGPQDPRIKATQGNGGITTKTLNDAVAVDQAFRNLDSALTEYGTLISKTGISMLPGQDSDAIGQSRTNLQLQLKELYNLGVLNGPDLSLMEKMIFDPQVSAWSPVDAFGKLYSAAGGPGAASLKDRADKSISRVRDMLKTIRDNKTRGILDEGGQFVGTAQQGGPYPGADGITSADQGGTFASGGQISEADLPGAIQEAQDAIASGADPQAVVDELVGMGVDPDLAGTLLNGQ